MTSNPSLALVQRIAALAAAPVAPEAVAWLRQMILVAEDRELFQINPMAVSKSSGLPEGEVIDAFLHATRCGLFSMSWNLLCPSCGATVRSHGSLGAVPPEVHCALCTLDSPTNLDDFVRVSFTVAPDARRIRYHDPDLLTIEDLTFGYHVNAFGRFASGLTSDRLFDEIVLHNSYREPASVESVVVPKPVGTLRFYDVIHEASVDCGPASLRSVVRVTFRNGGLAVDADAASPPLTAEGTLTLVLANQESTRQALMVLGLPDGPTEGRIQLDPFLSGKRVILRQTFRDLYRTETLVASDGLALQSVAVLFTDLKDSTALYQRVGDVAAFALVRQHFDVIRAVVAAHDGAVVKTIGDAVMACFLDPASALAASLELLGRLKSTTFPGLPSGVALKVGLHYGPVIAVTLNERLDYFGQTVNIAARIQALAQADEICLTEQVRSFAGFAAAVGADKLRTELATLKGIEGEVVVHRLMPSAT